MSLKFVDPPNGPPPAASYRHLAVVPAGRRLLVLAGQIGNLSDGTIVEGLEAQYEQALVNINTMRTEPAWTCCDYSDMLRDRDAEGDRAKAISLLDESLAISSELGMRPLMERVLSRREILKA